MRKTLINTAIMTGALLINYFLVPMLVGYIGGERFLISIVILGAASIVGTVLCRKLRYWLIPDAVHILLLWAAVHFDVNGNPYGLGIFFGWSPQILVWELAAVLICLIFIQAVTFGVITLIKAIKKRKKTTPEKSDAIG